MERLLQTNPQNPNAWQSAKRYDGGNPEKSHHNKLTKQDIYEPHA